MSTGDSRTGQMFALDMFFDIVLELAEVAAVHALPAVPEPPHLLQHVLGVQTLKRLPRCPMILVDMVAQTFPIGTDSGALGTGEA